MASGIGSDKSDVKKEQMLLALEKTRGNVTEAVKNVSIARSTHYEWMEVDEAYKKAVLSIEELAIDYAEGQLAKLMDGAEYEIMTDEGIQVLKDKPSATAVIFYLKTKGKKRGYIERQEITDANGNAPVQIITNPHI